MRNLIVALMALLLGTAMAYAWHGRDGHKVVIKSQALSQASMQPAKPVVFEASSSHASLESVAASVEKPSDSEFEAMKIELEKACDAGSPKIHIEHFDVNNNATPDLVCWRVLKWKGGSFVDYYIRVEDDGHRRFSYNAVRPCDTRLVRVERSTWDRKDFDEMGWDYIGPVSVDIVDDECDPFWLFWPEHPDTDDVDMVVARV